MELRAVHHIALQVQDLEKCAAFYRDVLGLAERSRQFRSDGALRSIWLAIGDAFLALEISTAPVRAGTSGWSMVALCIDRADRPALLARLGAAAVAVQHQTRWTVYVLDPEGNRVGFSHHPADPIE